jgi:hypothetical protein
MVKQDTRINFVPPKKYEQPDDSGDEDSIPMKSKI